MDIPDSSTEGHPMAPPNFSKPMTKANQGQIANYIVVFLGGFDVKHIIASSRSQDVLTAGNLFLWQCLSLASDSM